MNLKSSISNLNPGIHFQSAANSFTQLMLVCLELHSVYVEPWQVTQYLLEVITCFGLQVALFLSLWWWHTITCTSQLNWNLIAINISLVREQPLLKCSRKKLSLPRIASLKLMSSTPLNNNSLQPTKLCMKLKTNLWTQCLQGSSEWEININKLI